MLRIPGSLERVARGHPLTGREMPGESYRREAARALGRDVGGPSRLVMRRPTAPLFGTVCAPPTDAERRDGDS